MRFAHALDRAAGTPTTARFPSPRASPSLRSFRFVGRYIGLVLSGWKNQQRRTEKIATMPTPNLAAMLARDGNLEGRQVSLRSGLQLGTSRHQDQVTGLHDLPRAARRRRAVVISAETGTSRFRPSTFEKLDGNAVSTRIRPRHHSRAGPSFSGPSIVDLMNLARFMEQVRAHSIGYSSAAQGLKARSSVPRLLSELGWAWVA